MPKIKKEPYENSKKKNLFFYERLGITLAVLSFFAVAKLGSFGLYLFLIVKNCRFSTYSLTFNEFQDSF